MSRGVFMRRETKSRIRRIAAIPFFIFAPLLGSGGCGMWKVKPIYTTAGFVDFIVCFGMFFVPLVIGVCLWTELPTKET